jgi:hypothetical protein
MRDKSIAELALKLETVIMLLEAPQLRRHLKERPIPHTVRELFFELWRDARDIHPPAVSLKLNSLESLPEQRFMFGRENPKKAAAARARARRKARRRAYLTTFGGISLRGSHYLIDPVACTPASGWEKGQVENQVATSL